MAKIGTSVTVPVTSHADAHQKLINSLSGMKAKVSSDQGGVLTLKRGSQAKLRLLGGMFISDSDLPVLATIQFDSSKPSEAFVTVVENLVVGTTIGMSDKYQRSCTEFAQLIAQAIK
jgi:NAD/NADP transhydrogenase beta subunit